MRPASPSFIAGIKSPCKGSFHDVGTPRSQTIRQNHLSGLKNREEVDFVLPRMLFCEHA